MATMKDIASKLGVSLSTVSKGLNGASDISKEMRTQVIDAAIELGYISRSVRCDSTKKICIMIENMDYENSELFGYAIVNAFKAEAIKSGYSVDIVSTGDTLQQKQSYNSYILTNNYSGAFLLGFTLADSYYSELSNTPFPTVLLDNFIYENPHVGYVGTDSYEGMHLALAHLHKLGHRKIAFLNGDINSMVSTERLEAYMRFLSKHNLVYDDSLTAYCGYAVDSTDKYIEQFIKEGATAIMCASDIIAINVINSVTKLGLNVPKDISITGFDDISLAKKISPQLTTIRQSREDIGRCAFILLQALISGVPISKSILRPSLIKRESVGPA